MTSLDSVRDFLANAFAEARARGMRAPFILCGISPNGSILAMRMTEEGDGKTLTEHVEDGGFRLPMTFTIVDQNNDAARLTLTVSVGPQH